MKVSLTENRILKLARFAIITSFIIVFIVALSFLIGKWSDKNILSDISKTGPLGDAFNGITAPVLMLCMAVLTFLAFYVQYDFNRRQLNFNSSQLTIQSFFELFKLHLESAAKLKIQFLRNKGFDGTEIFNPKLEHGKVVSGKDFFAVLRYQMWCDAFDQIGTADDEPNALLLTDVVNIYSWRVYAPNDSQLGYYYRNLYHIFKFIANSEGLEPKQKRSFYSIVRAQLSVDELFILHYNFEFINGTGFKDLLIEENYFDDILEHIDSEKFIENHIFNSPPTPLDA